MITKSTKKETKKEIKKGSASVAKERLKEVCKNDKK